MILIDSRIGSAHLHPLIPGSELTRLDYGDAAWTSADGLLIGAEIKKLNDAVQCMFTGRLADRQIPGMRETYDVSYLLIEGIWRPEPGTGVLQSWREFDSSKEVKCGKWQDATSGRKRLMHGSFEQWLSTLEMAGGIRIRSTSTASSTAALILSLYTWWSRTGHASFDVLHQHEGSGAALSRPTMLRRMLALLPHIAWDRSAELAKRVGGVNFTHKSGRPMCTEDWYIEGQIAAKSAEDIMRACDGEND